MPDVNLDAGTPLNAGLDEDEPVPNLPYMRSGTQIFEDRSTPQGDQGESEEIEEKVNMEDLWDQYEKDPNFFKEITLATDGGMSEVDELVGPMRYITAVLTLSYVFINTWSIITVNSAYIWGPAGDENNIFLVSNYLLEGMPMMSWFIRDAQAVIGVLEISLIVVYLIRIFYWLWFVLFPGDSEMWRWTAVQELFWNAIPEAGVISSLKLLYFVTPSVLLPSLIAAITTASGTLGALLNLAWFFFSRGIAALVGFDAFLFKTQTVCLALRHAMTDENGNEVPLATFGDLLGLCITGVSYLNQMLGVVMLNWFVRKRIFAFIFAGEDGQMSEQEEALKETWESMLAQRIWQELKPHQAIATYLSYSDYDFQKLALETVVPGRERKTPHSKGHDERVAAREAAKASKEGLEVELIAKES